MNANSEVQIEPPTSSKVAARANRLWSAVTCHRFGGLADLSARPSRVQRLVEERRASPFDGDKSPAQKRGQVRALQNGGGGCSHAVFLG
jgi:hypothetical protein